MEIVKVRDSNMELLRIVATFFVMFVHADFLSLGIPKGGENLVHSIFQIEIESLSIVSVNLFVLISGWFGIHCSLKRILSLVFQCLFLYYAVLVLFSFTGSLGGGKLTLKAISGGILFNWYVLSYIGLYISSPILNLFVENATKKQYFLLLCIFFVFQSIYGWILENPSINMGYTVVSFMWLYLLASFLRKYTKELIDRCSKSFLLFIYFLMAQIISLVSIIFLLYGRSIWYNMYYYCSPIVIIESVSFFLLFTKFHFKNKVINSIAGSCLAVYLVHMHYYLQGQLNIYADSVSYIYNNFNRISFFMLISLFLLVVFCFSILLDKIRKIIWKKIEKLLGDVKLLTIKY